MNKTILLFLLTTIMLTKAFGQLNSNTLYKKLKTKKFYLVELSSETVNGQAIYKANGKEVIKSTYDKFQSTWKNMESCCPCILKFYNENDILLKEAVSCTDCGVGWFKVFYPNGNLKITGSYKENSTGKWKNIWDRGYCSVNNSQWTYFKENGDTLYSEFWKDGEFIKQVPEQSVSEIWDIELRLNGQKIDKQKLSITDGRNLKIIPKYKNSNTDSLLIVKFEVSATGHRPNKKEFTLNTFKNIDINKMFSEVEIPKSKRTALLMSIYRKEVRLKVVTLNLKK